MNIFISGGCKNGKSYYAQKRAKEQAELLQKPLYYIATMIPHDEEDHARIRRHLAEREGWGFETLEQGMGLTALLKRDDVDLDGVFLLDSVTAIMENEMFRRVEAANTDDEAEVLGEMDRESTAEGTGEDSGLKGKANIEIVYDPTAAERVKNDMVTFAKATGNTVFVSDGIYGDMGEYSQSTEDYRRALAAADLAIAKACDQVVEIAYGTEEIWK